MKMNKTEVVFNDQLTGKQITSGYETLESRGMHLSNKKITANTITKK